MGRWLRRLAPSEDAATRLICFAHAGGSASFYLSLARELGPGIEVLAVQNPGRAERYAEPRLESIAELADGALAEVRAAMDRPTALFGHSLGAVQAFEVTRRLERDDAAVTTLFVSSRRAPSTVRADAVHQRSDAGLVAELRALRGTDPRLLADPEVAQMLLAVIRSDYTAVETYRCEPGAQVSCPVIGFVGDRDPRVTLSDVRVWRDHTTGGFDARVFAGDHFYLADRVGDVARAVREQLDGVLDPN